MYAQAWNLILEKKFNLVRPKIETAINSIETHKLDMYIVIKQLLCLFLQKTILILTFYFIIIFLHILI